MTTQQIIDALQTISDESARTPALGAARELLQRLKDEQSRERSCKVVYGAVGAHLRYKPDNSLESWGDDGAYDLHDVQGSPAVIGKAIGEHLEATDLYHGSSFMVEDGATIYLTVVIAVARSAEELDTTTLYDAED